MTAISIQSILPVPAAGVAANRLPLDGREQACGQGSR